MCVLAGLECESWSQDGEQVIQEEVAEGGPGLPHPEHQVLQERD